MKDRANVLLFATRDSRLTRAGILTKAVEIRVSSRLDFPLEAYAATMLEYAPDTAGATILTDDYAPVDDLVYSDL